MSFRRRPTARYRAAVLARMRRRHRRRFGPELASVLVELPEATNYKALVTRLGRPADYAAELTGVRHRPRSVDRVAGLVLTWFLLAWLGGAPRLYEGLSVNVSNFPWVETGQYADVTAAIYRHGQVVMFRIEHHGFIPTTVLDVALEPRDPNGPASTWTHRVNQP